MTVMIDLFFGLPQSLVRGDKLREINGTAAKVYIALWHDSERFRTRELTLSDRQLGRRVKAHRNSLAKARRKLKDAGLLISEPYGAKGFLYQLCDPETGKPWPGPPDVQVRYVKKCGNSRAESVSQGPHSPKKISNSEIAGESFPFGHNAPEAQVSEQPSKASTSAGELHWDQIGVADPYSPAHKLCT